MIQIHEDKCIRCLRCADKCVCGAIEVRDGRPVINRDKGCIKCMHCAIACPENAITYNGRSKAKKCRCSRTRFPRTWRTSCSRNVLTVILNRSLCR